MTDQYLPDNAPRDILLSLQELSQKNIPHAATFKLAAARIAQLEAALKPFADIYSDTIAHEEAKWKDNHNLWESGVSTLITAGHLRAAATALKETGDE